MLSPPAKDPAPRFASFQSLPVALPALKAPSDLSKKNLLSCEVSPASSNVKEPNTKSLSKPAASPLLFTTFPWTINIFEAAPRVDKLPQLAFPAPSVVKTKPAVGSFVKAKPLA